MHTARIVYPVIIVLSAGSVALSAYKDETEEKRVERRSVSAKVVSTLGEGVGIRAKKVPGEFTVPKGFTATNFKFTFHDPKSKVKLNKLTDSSIYSVEEKRYIAGISTDSKFELPPGKYKFVVGGSPGAYGSLSFDVTARESNSVTIKDSVPEADLPRDGRLSVVVWDPATPTFKLYWTLVLKAGSVTGTGDFPNPPDSHVNNYTASYQFRGRLVDKHIEGTDSQRIAWEADLRNGKVMKHTFEGNGKMKLRLRVDGTVVGSEIFSGKTNGKPSIQDKNVNLVGKWTMNTKEEESDGK